MSSLVPIVSIFLEYYNPVGHNLPLMRCFTHFFTACVKFDVKVFGTL
jgi:hypothetical protein